MVKITFKTQIIIVIQAFAKKKFKNVTVPVQYVPLLIVFKIVVQKCSKTDMSDRLNICTKSIPHDISILGVMNV